MTNTAQTKERPVTRNLQLRVAGTGNTTISRFPGENGLVLRQMPLTGEDGLCVLPDVGHPDGILVCERALQVAGGDHGPSLNDLACAMARYTVQITEHTANRNVDGKEVKLDDIRREGRKRLTELGAQALSPQDASQVATVIGTGSIGGRRDQAVQPVVTESTRLYAIPSVAPRTESPVLFVYAEDVQLERPNLERASRQRQGLALPAGVDPPLLVGFSSAQAQLAAEANRQIATIFSGIGERLVAPDWEHANSRTEARVGRALYRLQATLGMAMAGDKIPHDIGVTTWMTISTAVEQLFQNHPIIRQGVTRGYCNERNTLGNTLKRLAGVGI